MNPDPQAEAENTDLETFQRMMQGAFQEFNLQSLALQQAYQALKEETARINLELEQKNQELSQTNLALAQMSAFLNNMFQGMSGGLLVLDAEGRILKFNAGFSRLVQEKTEPWIGSPLDQIPALEPLNRLVRTLRGDPQRNVTGACKINVPDGERLLEITGSCVLDSPGREFLLLIRDMTEMKDLRKQLVQNESLAGLGRLAVTVAHEIRNPLGGIEGFASLLKRDLEGNPQQGKLVEKIIHGVRSLNAFITQLLTFAKTFQVNPQNFVLASTVGKAVQYTGMDTRQPKAGAVRLRHRVPGTLRLRSDPDLIQQMLLNLLINALDVSDPGGQIQVTARDFPGGLNRLKGGALHSLQSIHYDGLRRHAGIFLSDSGPGLDREIAEQMFTPFFTTKATGTGIGLSMVQKIIEILEGRLDVYSGSALGGAEFRIYLPDLL